MAAAALVAGVVLVLTSGLAVVRASQPGLILDTATVDVAENGGEAEYTVKLNALPTGSVIVSISSDDTSVANVSPEELTFTTSDWSEAQTVTVTGVNDVVDNTSDRTATITNTPSGGGYGNNEVASVTVTTTDDDTRGVTVSETGVSVTENGGTATYAVVLTSEPTYQVTVSPSSSRATAATRSPTSLTFTTSNWSTAQFVTVTGVNDDVDNDSARTATITHSGTGYELITLPSVTVTVTDDDEPGVTISRTAVTMAENSGTASYKIKLNSKPTADVTMTVVIPGVTEVATVSPAELEFTTASYGPKTVTVTGKNDDVDNTTARTATITHTVSSNDPSYNGILLDSVTATLIDDDGKELTLSKSSITGLHEDGTPSQTYTVKLTQEPSANVTVAIAGLAGVVDVSPESLTFTPDNYNTTQTVTVTGVEDDVDSIRTVTITNTPLGGRLRRRPLPLGQRHPE